jgi:hypothetical protein
MKRPDQNQLAKRILRWLFVRLIRPLTKVHLPGKLIFEYSRAFGLMLIKVEVNRKSALMVLDTGSNETISFPPA